MRIRVAGKYSARRLFPPYKRRGFTLLELLIACSILIILSSLTAVNYAASRQRTRDSRRKADVRGYVNALNNFNLSHANFFVTNPNDTTTACHATSSVTDDDVVPAPLAIPNNCVGASGRSFGQLNAKSTSVPGYTPSGYPFSFASHRYPGTSIAEALKAGGYLASIAIDPAKTQDYVLVRCCLRGQQNVTEDGQFFAVWTKLEGSLTPQESETSRNFCGGAAAGPSRTPAYQYDYGTGNSGFATGNVYSLGNLSPKSRLSMSGAYQPCD